MLAQIFAIVAPVFLTCGIGYFWGRSDRPFDTSMVATLVTYFATPCLVFYALATAEISMDDLKVMGGAAVASNVVFWSLGAIILALFKLPQRTYLPVLTFPNIGNVGLPICLLAFGPEGLALAVTYFAVFVVIQLTIGVAFVAGTFSIKQLAQMPIIPATVAAAVFNFGGYTVPDWLFNTTKIVGDLTIPLMLVALGVSLARLGVKNMKRSIAMSVLRLGMGFGGGYAIAMAFGATGMSAGVIILQCAMPTAVFVYLFAQVYNRDPDDVAGTVIASNVIGFMAMPALLWFVLQL